MILLSRTGQQSQGVALARDAMANQIADYDLLNATVNLARQAGDYPLAIQAVEARMAGWPETRAAGYVQLGKPRRQRFARAAKGARTLSARRSR